MLVKPIFIVNSYLHPIPNPTNCLPFLYQRCLQDILALSSSWRASRSFVLITQQKLGPIGGFGCRKRNVLLLLRFLSLLLLSFKPEVLTILCTIALHLVDFPPLQATSRHFWENAYYWCLSVAAFSICYSQTQKEIRNISTYLSQKYLLARKRKEISLHFSVYENIFNLTKVPTKCTFSLTYLAIAGCNI